MVTPFSPIPTNHASRLSCVFISRARRCDRTRSCEKSTANVIPISRWGPRRGRVVLAFRFVKHGGGQGGSADAGRKEASRNSVEAHRAPGGAEWSVGDRPRVKDGPSCAQDQGISGDFVFQFSPQGVSILFRAKHTLRGPKPKKSYHLLRHT